MGQPITVVEKPPARPGYARFEANRSFTGMGHESYDSVDDILADRPVDELARRLFATGQVRSVHVSSNIVTVGLREGQSGGELADVIRRLYLYYEDAPGGEAESVAESSAPSPD